MTAQRPTTMVRALVGLLSIAVVLSPVLMAEAGNAKKRPKSQNVKFRKVSAPNVFFPITGTKAVKDKKTFRNNHPGTDIQAPCGATIWASHPGVAQVVTNAAWGGKVLVRVVSGRNGLVTQYGFLTRALVAHGQIIQSGQAIGVLGANPSSKACALYFSVAGNGRAVNPTSWLNAMVGKTPPVSGMFNTRAIYLASFNVLGASHTASGQRYSTYPSRLVRAMSLLNSRALDVVGTQEFQEIQYDYFVDKGYDKTWGAYYWDPEGKRRDTENAIIWRKATMEFVEGSTFDIPYFGGNIRHVPAVLLRQKSSGRTAWFLNVHNPANVKGNAAGWRAKAIQIEKNKMIELRRTGRPVFLTGDFNDRQAAFCPLTADKLSISPNSIPSMGCAYPKQTSIDWIFAAGQTRFSFFSRDTYPQSAKISDHPIVIARAHLQN
jgi:endonuclease/exonuclease/phosphatase family metal-dependent hydrolase